MQAKVEVPVNRFAFVVASNRSARVQTCTLNLSRVAGCGEELFVLSDGSFSGPAFFAVLLSFVRNWNGDFDYFAADQRLRNQPNLEQTITDGCWSLF